MCILGIGGMHYDDMREGRRGETMMRESEQEQEQEHE